MEFSSRADGLCLERLKLISRRLESGPETSKSNKFVIVSFDTLPEELKLLKNGYCSALIGQRPYAMGERAWMF